MKRTRGGKGTRRPAVFRDPSTLEDDYIPSRIQHRDKQVKEINYFLSSLVRYGIRSNNIIVYGDPGTGKTHCVGSVLSDLEGAIETFYCGAYRGTSVHAFFRRFLEKRFNVSLHPRESMSVYYRAFEGALRDLNNVLLVIDDIQYLLQDDPKGLDGLLFYLSRLEKKLGLILIGNVRMHDVSEALEPATKSSLRLRSVYFPKYNALELKDILTERAKEALAERAFERSRIAIQLIAARTAQEWGSARHALDLLKEAGMVSEEICGEDHISGAAVRDAEKRLELSKTEEQVRDLPPQALAVMEAIYQSRGKSKLSTGDVYSVYEKVCRERGLDAFSLRKVSDIITRLDSDGLISFRLVFSGRLGRTRHISWLSNPVLEEVYERERQVFVS